MNILILSTHFNTGGITSYILTLAQGLSRKGHNVYVATSGGNMVAELVAAGVKHVSYDIKTKSEVSPKIFLALPKISRFIKEKKIDVIHAHTRVTQVTAAMLCRLTGTPYVTTCHGFYKKRLSRKLFPCWGAETVAISEAVRDYLIRDYRLADSKVCLIHAGVNPHMFLQVDEGVKRQRRQQYNLGGEPLIGIIARLTEEKGHRFLIEAMKQIVKEIYNAHLLIVGRGRIEKDLKEAVDLAGLNNCIHFYPVVNQTTEILPLLDVFVLPSLDEGFGLSILEAQAAGLPVVASRVGGVPDLIKDGETGILVAHQDIDGLAKAVIEILKDKKRAKELGSNARRFVEEEFSVGQFVEKTLGVYTAALKIHE